MSLRRRIWVASALAAAIGGALATLVAGTLSLRLVADHEDERVRDAAMLLAAEVEEEILDEDDDDDRAEWPGPRTLSASLAHELDDDVHIVGARARLDRDGTLGDASLPVLPVGICAERELAGVPQRVCTVAFDERGIATGTLTLSVDDGHAREQRAIFGWALLAGLLCGALAGAVVSTALARWSLRPLTALGERVRDIVPTDPAPAVLGPPAPEEEIEALRGSLATLLEELRASLSVARSFAADASHELRTPLAKIAAELELLEESAVGSDRVGLSRARGEVQSLASLVERLLLLARPEEAAGREAVDVREVIEDVLVAMRPALRDRVALDAPPELVVKGDARLLGALVGNAIENALKFSTGPVAVMARAETDRVVLTVTDEGAGIPANDRDRLFRPFVRGADRAEPGHGIGLALIDRVARSHGGTARFVDAPRGARLEVRLPAWPRDDGEEGIVGALGA